MTVAALYEGVQRNVALYTDEAWQGRRHFKEEAAELWQYPRFRFERWVSQIWPFWSPAWLKSSRMANDQGLGKSVEREDVIYLPADHPIFDPKTDQLFTAEAARRAFAHVDVTGQKDTEIASQREERLSTIVIGGIALGMLVAFVAALAAILFMK